MNLLSRLVIPAPVQAGWALLKPLLPYLAILGLLGGLLVTRATLSHTKADRDAHYRHYADVMTISRLNFERAREQARADDLANARRVETAQTHVTQESSHALESQLADARRAAAEHSARMQSNAPGQADRSGGGAADMPRATDTTGGAADARSAAVLAADDDACAEAVIKAQGWQEWWTEQARIAR